MDLTIERNAQRINLTVRYYCTAHEAGRAGSFEIRSATDGAGVDWTDELSDEEVEQAELEVRAADGQQDY